LGRFFGTYFATLANSRRKKARFLCGRTILPKKNHIEISDNGIASNHNLSKVFAAFEKADSRATVWIGLAISKAMSKCTRNYPCTQRGTGSTTFVIDLRSRINPNSAGSITIISQTNHEKGKAEFERNHDMTACN